jgi:hypothetical protein
MRKGFLLTLLAAAVIFSVTAPVNAAAPVLGEVPVVVMSDIESRVGSTDNNVFEFTDAWTFADYVTDSDTAEGSLQWSFDYDPLLSGNVGTIEINGIDRLNVPTGDPLNPGAFDIRAAGATATYRETTLSPTAGTPPFPDPSGTPGTIPGITGTVEIAGSLTVTYFVSDGTDFDMDDSFVYAVDTGIADVGPPDTVPMGVPTLSFTGESLTGWTYQQGGPATPTGADFIGGATSGTTGGLQHNLPQAQPGSFTTQVYSAWFNGGLATFVHANNTLYGIRSTLSNNFSQDGAAQTRIRVEALAPTTDGDQEFTIACTAAGHPFNIPTTPRQYLAYWRSLDLGTAGVGQQGAAFDAIDNGNAAGARTVTMSVFEVGSTDPANYLGSPNSVPGGNYTGGGFGGWTYTNFGPLTFLGATFFEGGTSGTASGRLQHTDNDPAGGTDPGGAAEWAIGEQVPAGNDLIETSAGAVYSAEWDIAQSDTVPPQFRWNTRAATPAGSTLTVIRNTSTGFSGTPATPDTFRNFWVGHNFSGAAGAGNRDDDNLHAWGMVNFAGAGTRGGTIDLFEVRMDELAADDPNVP